MPTHVGILVRAGRSPCLDFAYGFDGGPTHYSNQLIYVGGADGTFDDSLITYDDDPGTYDTGVVNGFQYGLDGAGHGFQLFAPGAIGPALHVTAKPSAHTQRRRQGSRMRQRTRSTLVVAGSAVHGPNVMNWYGQTVISFSGGGAATVEIQTYNRSSLALVSESFGPFGSSGDGNTSWIAELFIDADTQDVIHQARGVGSTPWTFTATRNYPWLSVPTNTLQWEVFPSGTFDDFEIFGCTSGLV